MHPLELRRRGSSIVGEIVLHGWPRYLRPLLHELIARPPIREILPGVHHWTGIHPRIRQPVSSYYVEPVGLLLDPLVPREGIEWFERRPPAQVVLSNRHHFRQSDRFVEAFDCIVRCSAPGLHEFEDGRKVQGFAFGEEIAPRVTAIEVGAICPDETAVQISIGDGAIVFADALTRPGGGELAFVPDFLMGDDPGAVKAGLLNSFHQLLELSFDDSLLFAHGDPLIGGGKRALSEFVDRQRRDLQG